MGFKYVSCLWLGDVFLFFGARDVYDTLWLNLLYSIRLFQG